MNRKLEFLHSLRRRAKLRLEVFHEPTETDRRLVQELLAELRHQSSDASHKLN
ncbi:MAG TPA: hypothetical protein VGF69_23490 [Thermoanaerobaculia bacterium]|jgi:hypothetical protein